MNLVQQYDQEHKARQQRFAEAAARINSPVARDMPRIWEVYAEEAAPPVAIRTWISNKLWFVFLAEAMVRPVPKVSPGLRVIDIQRAVAEHFKITLNDLNSLRRTASVVRPRQIALYLSRMLTSRSLPEIGRRCGGKDHTTVLHAVRVCERILELDEDYADDIRYLLAKLEPVSKGEPS